MTYSCHPLGIARLLYIYYNRYVAGVDYSLYNHIHDMQ